MVLLLIIAVYLTGYISAYFIFRSIVKAKNDGSWVLLEKIVVIALSLFSWFGLLICSWLIIGSVIFNLDLDKECKW